MSLQEKIRNIIFLFVKNEYNTYLQNNNIKFINDNEINNVISSFYIDKKKELKLFIKSCLKEMMAENYPGALVENIIFEIFQDEELAINRVSLEIQKYQEYIMTNNNGKEYDITVPIDPDYGIGLKIDFFENDVLVKNYKRNKQNQLLSAEQSGQISIGDSIIKINDIDLEKMSTKDKIQIVKNAMEKDFIKLSFRTFIDNINIEKNS